MTASNGGAGGVFLDGTGGFYLTKFVLSFHLKGFLFPLAPCLSIFWDVRELNAKYFKCQMFRREIIFNSL